MRKRASARDEKACKCALDTFFSGNNGATRLFGDSNDSSIQAESNGTHHDCSFKNIGSGLGHYSTCAKGRQSVNMPKVAPMQWFQYFGLRLE